MRTQAISDSSFTLNRDSDSFVPITKPVYNGEREIEKRTVRIDDLFYVKGGNVGAIGIADFEVQSLFSSHIFKLRIEPEIRHYVFAILKSDFGKAQVQNLPLGAIKGLDSFKAEYFNKIVIPFPNNDAKQIINYVGILVKAVIRKETKIKEKMAMINKIIEIELLYNQKDIDFDYSLPTYNELMTSGRLDTGLYSNEYKQLRFIIENYKSGTDNVYRWGFKLSRGQNLQISNIGKSIYSEEPCENCYKLLLPTNLTPFGTVSKVMYLGNKNKLKCLEKGDIVFGAEGFEKGRSIVITEDVSKTITNIHGITLKSEKHNLTESIFIKCFLDYLRSKGLIDKYAVGGSGGSLAQQYWDIITFPKFSISKQEEIAKLYNNSSNLQINKLTLNEFENEDRKITDVMGILQLDMQIKFIKQKLIETVNGIVNDKDIKIDLKLPQ
jgi:type I restriction enzyme S subunit